MANELAVKVKVNLDTSAKALDAELKKITTYSESHPATISIKVDSKSLKKSIEDAFGKGATQNMTSAANKVNDVSKNMNKLIGNMRELNKWEKQLATAQASPNFKTDEIDELGRKINVCKQNIDDAKTALTGLNYDWKKNIKFDGLGDKLQRELDIVKSKAVGTEKKNAANENAADQVKQQTAINEVVSQYTKHLNEATDAEIKMNAAREKGDSQSELDYYNQMDAAIEKMAQDAQDYKNLISTAQFPVDDNTAYTALQKESAVVEAMEKAVNKETDAYNNLAFARQKAEQASANASAAKSAKEEQDAVNAVIKALQEKTQKQIEYNKYAQKNDTRNMQEKYYEQTQAAQKLADAEAKATALNPAWRQKQEYIDALDDSIAKTAVSLNDYANAQDKALSGQQAQEQAAQEKELTAAVREYLAAAREASKYNVDMINSSASGRQDNVESYANQMVAATEKMGAAADKMRSLGVEPTQIKEVFDVITTEAGKSEIAVNNLNKTMQDLRTKDIQDAFNGLTDAMDRAANAEAAMYKARQSGDTANETEQLRQLGLALKDIGQYSDYLNKHGVDFTQFTEFENTSQSGAAKVNSAYNSMEKAIDRAANANDSLNASIDNTIEKANALNATTQKNGAGKVDMTVFNQAFQEFNDIANNTSGKYSDLKVMSDALQKSLQKMSIAAGNINTALKDDSAVTRANTNFANLNAQITRFLNNNPRVSSDAGMYAQFQALATATEECSGDIDKLRMQEAQLEAQSERLGLTTETLAGKFSRLFKEHFQTAAVMAGIHLTQQGFQQVYQNVVEVDTAMTELKKVTDETDATYSAFMQTTIQQSRDLAASISDTVSATADFARLGYTLDEATDLSKAAITYQHVGDGISDISEATESIISTMKAFNIEAKDSMSIVDRFNKVGNEFAISSGDIGDALQRSASALHTAGNDINESIGMIVAANDVAQNPESVGNALKVLSLRIRGAKTELKEMGEDTETVAESTSKLQASIKGLTGVDIMKSATEFKSTYQIMDELAAKWKELDDISKASTLEQLAGKNRANVVAGMLENWQDAKAAADAARDSYGSAEAELDKYKESIAGLSEQLKASFGALSETLLDDDIVKGLLKIATGISDATNEAIKFVGVLPTLAGALSGAFAVGGPKLTGSLYVPTNTLMVTWNELAA